MDNKELNELLARGLKSRNTKNFDEAWKIVKELQKVAPHARHGYYLEAAIWNILDNSVKEFYACEKLLPLLRFSSPEEKNFSSEIFYNMGVVCKNLSLHKEACEFYRLSINFTDDEEESLDLTLAIIFLLNFSEEFSAADFHECYNECKKYLLKMGISPFPKRFYNHEKIRIGFLSGDFHLHPVVNWSWALLTKLDKNLFEVFFYSNSKISDKVTNHLHSVADGWRDIFDLTDEEAAKIIHNDEIDILFDLSGHTSDNRLRVAAYQPASVQISGIGYMNSTGLDCFDYFLSDVYCAGNPKYFTEKLIKMPHSHICYESSVNIEPAANPPCIKNNFVTFGSFNRFDKITDSILSTWKKILDAVPNSRLIFKHTIFDTADGKNFVCERLKNLGLDLSRVEMRSANYKWRSDSKNIWLYDYDDIDIALDTFPYTGGVTTCEALYMGVPVISLYGGRHGSRFGLSILSNVGLGELAVDSYDEYIKRAAALAGDWELLTILRKNLRTMMKKSPLMDAEGYVRDIEKIFVKILSDEREKFLNG